MKTFEKNKFVIVDSLSAPRTSSVAELLHKIENSPVWMAIYLCEGIPNVEVHATEGEFTFVEDFGIELDFSTEGYVSAKQVGESKATYEDGSTREWQDGSDLGHKFQLKVGVVDWKKEYEKQFDLFMAQGNSDTPLLEYEDLRFKRKVECMRNASISFGGKFLRHLVDLADTRYPRMKDKYMGDWNRMNQTRLQMLKEAVRDPWSRQLVVSNMDGFYVHLPCFMTLQFLLTGDRGFIMIVNQRSLDRAKFYDDLKFFGEFIAHFEEHTGFTVFQMDLVIGDIHREK